MDFLGKKKTSSNPVGHGKKENDAGHVPAWNF